MITTQLNLFGKAQWGSGDIAWQTLERHGCDLSTDEVIDHLELYMGKLPKETILIPVQVLYVPESNFFLMPLLGKSNCDEKTN